MTISIAKKTYLLGSLLGLAGTLSGGNALAYAEQKRDYSDGDTAGGEHFRASYGWWGYTRNNTETTGNMLRSVTAAQSLWGDVRVLGRSFRAFTVSSTAFARNSQFSNVPYEKLQEGKVELGGQTLYNAQVWNTTCPGRSSAYGCSSYSRSLTKTLMSPKGEFSFGILSFTVTASVTGSVYGSVNADTYSTTYLGKANSFYGRATAAMDAGGYITSYNTAEGGIPYVAEVGLGVELTLLDLSYTPSMQAYQTVTRSGTRTTGRRGHANYDSLALNTLSGNVLIYLKLAGQVVDSFNLLSWDGYTWIGEWVNDSAYEDLL